MAEEKELNPIKDLLPTCRKNTVKELLTSMSADTYTWLRDEVVKDRKVLSMKHSIKIVKDDETSITAVVIFVLASGDSWKKEDSNMYIFRTGTADPSTARKVVEDMYKYYCKEILQLEEA